MYAAKALQTSKPPPLFRGRNQFVSLLSSYHNDLTEGQKTFVSRRILDGVIKTNVEISLSPERKGVLNIR
jgi:hypothetical protein